MATRQRRQRRQLEALEKDNFHDDPHAAFAHLAAKAKLPAFADGSDSESMSTQNVCMFSLSIGPSLVHCHWYIVCGLVARDQSERTAPP